MDDNFPREFIEPVISRTVELEELGQELSLCFHDIQKGDCEITTCYGDICKVINALMDYARLLGIVCDQWELKGFHRATYEYQAEKLKAIAKKYQAGIGYDYDAAIKRCKKKKLRTSDIGGDAMELAVKGYRR